MTNCKNCGAPLPANGKCEYCGSFFPEAQYIVRLKVNASIDRDELLKAMRDYSINHRRIPLWDKY